jgi:GntR family transcriptional regulator
MATSSPVARYHVIEMALATRIREGVYDRTGLPGERALAEEFSAARVTIRTALKRLQDQGLVLRTERRGTVAAARAAAGRPRLLREHVDKFLDRGRPDRRQVLSFGWTLASPFVAQQLGLMTGEKVLRVLRLRSDEGGTLTYSEVHVPRAVAPAISRAGLARKAFVQLLEDHGIRFGAADQVVACEAAGYEVARALDIAIRSPILKLTRVLYDADGLPIQLFTAWYRADRFQLRMRLSRGEDATKVEVERI